MPLGNKGSGVAQPHLKRKLVGVQEQPSWEARDERQIWDFSGLPHEGGLVRRLQTV